MLTLENACLIIEKPPQHSFNPEFGYVRDHQGTPRGWSLNKRIANYIITIVKPSTI